MCDFGRGYYEERFCEIILVQEKMLFKRFLIWSSGCPPVLWGITIYAILIKGIIGNNNVKLFRGEISFKETV